MLSHVNLQFTCLLLALIGGVVNSEAFEPTSSGGGCANALYVSPPYVGQVVFDNTEGADTYLGPQCGLNYTRGSGTAFFVVSPSVGSTFNVSTCWPNTQFDTAIAVYAGDDCGSLNCIASNDDFSCGYVQYAASLSFTTTLSTYWIMVTGYNGEAGQFEMSLTETGSGSSPQEGCNDAISIRGPFVTPISIVGEVTAEANAQPCSQSIDSTIAGDWFLIYPTAGSTVTVTTCNGYNGTLSDTVLAVISGSCASETCVVVNDDMCGSYAPTLSTVSFYAKLESYYVYITGSRSYNGTYEIQISEVVPNPSSTSAPSYSPTASPAPSASRTSTASISYSPTSSASRTPSNYPSPSPSARPSPLGSGNGDTCMAAHYLADQGVYKAYNLNGGTVVTSLCSFSVNSPVKWFSFRPPLGNIVSISTCTGGTDIDPLLAVFTACEEDDCQLANDNSSCGHGSKNSYLEFYAYSDTYYLAVVTADDDDSGDFDLILTYTDVGFSSPALPSGNGVNCSESIYLPGAGTYPGFSNYVGDVVIDMCGEDTDSAAVWFYIQPPSGTTITISTCSAETDLDTVIAVFTACDPDYCRISNDNANSCMHGSSKSTVEFTSESHTYYVAVSGRRTYTGVFELVVQYAGSSPISSPTPLPSGSGYDCTNPMYLPGDGFYPGFSTYATGSIYELCDMETDSNTMWFYFTPPQGLSVTVSTCSSGTDFDTAIAIFSSCNANGCVNSNDDDKNCSYSRRQSTVTFYSEQKYYIIAVTGYQENEGQFDLTISY